MREIENILPTGGLNLDDDKRVMINTDSDFRKNIQYENDGKFGTIVPIKGNEVIGSLINTPSGSCEDYERGVGVIFGYKEDSGQKFGDDYTTIYEADDSGSELILEAEDVCEINQQVDARAFDGKLFFTDNYSEPKKINIDRAKNTTYWKNETVKEFVGETLLVHVGDFIHIPGMGIYERVSGGTTGLTYENIEFQLSSGHLVLEEDDIYWNYSLDEIALIKQPPTHTVEVEEVVESSERNEITERLMAFSYRYIYKDNERSVFAKPSRVVFNPYASGTEQSSLFNAVDITIYRGGEDVRKVEVAMQNVQTGNWFKVGEVLNKDFFAQPTYDFRFRGGMVMEPLANIEVDKPFDAVPLTAKSLTLAENRVSLFNIKEGYEVKPPKLTLQVLSPDARVVFPTYVINRTNNRTLWNTSPAVLELARRRYPITSYAHDEIVAFGTTLVCTVETTVSGVEYRKEYSVSTTGSETALDFLKRFASEINQCYYDSFWQGVSVQVRDLALALWASAVYDGDNFQFYISQGAPNILRLQGIPSNQAAVEAYLGESFIGDVTSATYESMYNYMTSAVPSVGNNTQRVEGVTQTFATDAGTQIYKGNSTYDVGITYYDWAMRKVPVVAKESITMPSGQFEDGIRPIEVTIEGQAPSWAKHFSIARTRGSITDGEMIRLGGGNTVDISSVEGDSSPNLIMDINVEGIPLSKLYEGKIFWRMQWDDRRFYLFEYTGSDFVRLAMTDRTSNKPFEYFDEVKCKRLNFITPTPVGYPPDYSPPVITGSVLLRDSAIKVNHGLTQSRALVVNANTKLENNGEFYYRLDIAPYINAIRKGLTDDRDVFTPKKNDKIRIHKDSAGAQDVVLSVENIDTRIFFNDDDKDDTFFQFYSIETHKTTEDLNFDEEGLIEIYRETDDPNLFFEEDILYDIEDGKHLGLEDVGTYGTRVLTSRGDAFLRNREYLTPTGDILRTEIVESPRVSDSFNSKLSVLGRPNGFEREVKQKHFNTGIRHGGRLLEETLINDTCSFDSANVRILSADYGSITRGMERPNALRVLCKNRAITIEIGRSIVTRPDGTEEMVAIDRYLGSERASRNRWGTEDFHSVINTGTDLFYFDKNSRQMLSDGQNGQFPISGKVTQGEFSHDYKMHSYFDRLTGFVRCGWDGKNQMLYVTGTNEGTTKTVTFHRPTNRWLGYVDMKSSLSGSGMYNVQQYLSIKDRMFSLWRGRLYIHDSDNVPRTKFYYDIHGAKVKLIANQHPMNMKLFDALTLRVQGLTSIPDEFISLYIEPNDTYLRGMESVITSEMLRLEEGEYRAAILRNMLTSSTTPSVIDLHNGEDMRGYYVELDIDFGANDFKLLGASVLQTVSK